MSSIAPAKAFIASAPRDLAAWAACFDAASLPVLLVTADSLEELRANEDAVDAHLLSDALSSDPLMVLKVLAHVAALRCGREGSDIETVTEALVMLGITPFFRDFGPQTAVDEVLHGQPAALVGFHKVLRRARRAANFAMAFAVHRMDADATVIHEAALLHDFAELLLWLRAPALALEIERLQGTDAQLRSAQAQRQVLNIELADLQHALMQHWRLPALLVHITDQHHSADMKVRNVLLAIRLARHSALGWHNPALPDDVHDIASLLNLGTEPTLRLLHQVDDS
jgi:HD-like signal output (HDOD) protein